MKKHDWFVVGGLILWIAETWYFGWNEEALTVQEKMLDAVCLWLIGYGALLGLGHSIKTQINITMGKESRDDIEVREQS